MEATNIFYHSASHSFLLSSPPFSIWQKCKAIHIFSKVTKYVCVHTSKHEQQATKPRMTFLNVTPENVIHIYVTADVGI